MLFSFPFNFNTSHVTVYLNVFPLIHPVKWFQYISCYCLSLPDHKYQHCNKWFQYISCYCLSKRDSIISMAGTNFNTSHVTVYPFTDYRLRHDTFISIHLMLLFIFLPSTSLISRLHFNTSHVTVYQFPDTFHQFVSVISIHLMLLFIRKKA